MEQLKSPIRVLEVFGRMDRGGAEAMIMNLYRKMDRTKVQLDFMVHTEERCQFDDEIEKLGGHIYHVPRFKVHNFISYRKAWKKFFKEHPEYRVVHGHMGATAAIYLYEANKTGCFSIAHSHSVGMLKTLDDVLYKFFSFPTRYVAKQMFGCSTQAGAARYGERVVKGAHYINFPNAIDLKRFEFHSEERMRIRKELNIAQEQLMVIHVGRLTAAKNPEMILKVFSEVVRKDANAICLWVGTGELEDKYQRLIQEQGLQNRIRMLGVRTDIPQLLQAADVFLFPSLWEGLPVSVVEAQATGLPCVIADTISKEVKITSLVEFHSLSEPPGLWAERCMELGRDSIINRESPLTDIRKAGYDIDESVKWLEDFYINQSHTHE